MWILEMSQYISGCFGYGSWLDWYKHSKEKKDRQQRAKNLLHFRIPTTSVLCLTSIPLLPRGLRNPHRLPRNLSRGQRDPHGPRRTHPLPYPLRRTSERKHA